MLNYEEIRGEDVLQLLVGFSNFLKEQFSGKYLFSLGILYGGIDCKKPQTFEYLKSCYYSIFP